MSTRTATAPGIEDMLARKSKEPPLATGPSRRPRKAAPKAKAAPKPQPAIDPRPLTTYTSFSITFHQRQLLRDEAHRRASAGITTRSDVSSVLRDLLDFCEAHQKEVQAWTARQQRSQRR